MSHLAFAAGADGFIGVPVLVCVAGQKFAPCPSPETDRAHEGPEVGKDVWVREEAITKGRQTIQEK
jgi:hypothetical protein